MKYQWNSLKKRSRYWTRRRPLFAGALLLAGMSGPGVWAADPVPGFTGPDPDNAFSFDLEGCRLDQSTESTYDPTATPPVLVCDSLATWPTGGDAYTDGNLGMQWNELDLVPHRFGSDSSGLVAASQTFQVIVGADNLVDDDPDDLAIGYDRVVNFVLNEALSTGSPADCQLTLIGGNSFGDFGLGGSIEQVVQVLEITQTADTLCVWDFVERLALTSSNIPGSSNRSFIVAGTGAQSVPLPSNIQPQVLSKEMSAVEDSLVKWTIEKDADPVTFDFADTCDATNPDTKDVEVTITYTRGTAEPFAVTATSMVQVTNPASRNVIYQCTDDLYGIASGDLNESLLGTEFETEVVEPGMESFDIVHNVGAGARSLRNELSCDLFVVDILGGPDIPVGTLEASFSLPDNDIADGDVVNDEVVISDTESISGTGFSFSTGDPTGTSGAFDGYTPGTDTTGPVLWDSDPQTSSGTIVFTKTVKVDRFTATTGTLSDTATLPLTDATDVEASASTSLSAGFLVDLTIQKSIPGILQGEETIACNFTVKDSNDQEVATPVINFAAGEFFKETTLSNLDPDVYTVIEGECGGLIPAGNANIIVDLSAPTSFEECSANAFFDNVIPDVNFATAEVTKVTMPAGLEDGWTMTLTGPGTNGGIVVVTSDGDPTAFEAFLDPDTNQPFSLLEGDYTIDEVLKDGWQNTASTGCSFSVNYPDDFGKTFQCSFTNKQYGKVIIEKQTIPDGETDTFDYSQDIDGSGDFSLMDDGQKVFLDVVANDPASPYTVTESDPAPAYDLTALDCTDDFDGNGYNINSSSGNPGTGVATINVDPGETVKCVYTNTKRGMVEVLKLTNGFQDPNMQWNFTLVGPDVNESDSVPPNPMDFNGAKLIPGEIYTLCEVGIPPSWTSNWQVDTDGDGVADTIIPFLAADPDPDVGSEGYSPVYDPNYVPPPDVYTNDTRCVKFIVDPDETLVFEIDNTRPGGEPRTIGYWKNWNTCTGGNQDITAANNGGPDAGWFLLDDLLNNPGYLIGDLVLGSGDCEDAVGILDKRDIVSGKKKASDAAYGLAAQLLAALLNFSAGAETCDAAVNAANAGQQLLDDIDFNGTGNYLKGKNADGDRALANELAGLLDEYNNGFLCN